MKHPARSPPADRDKKHRRIHDGGIDDRNNTGTIHSERERPAERSSDRPSESAPFSVSHEDDHAVEFEARNTQSSDMHKDSGVNTTASLPIAERQISTGSNIMKHPARSPPADRDAKHRRIHDDGIDDSNNTGTIHSERERPAERSSDRPSERAPFSVSHKDDKAVESEARNTQSSDMHKDSGENKTMSFAERQMAKMGHVTGQGLGRKATGIVEPIAESMQMGRRGLGFEVDGLNRSVVTDQDIEAVSVKVHLDWMAPCLAKDIPTSFENWLTEGSYSSKIVPHEAFKESTVLADLLAAKTLLDNVGRREFLSARNQANPFEGLKSEFFQNRAALKMAEMDAIFDFVFTQPTDLSPWELLYFADICAGPGGFSEYVMWRKKWMAKGFGFSIVGNLDFKLQKFNKASPWDSFHTHYGVDNTGNIYNNENVRSLRQLVSDQTHGQMVRFVMADGGMDFTKDQNAQELTNTQLLLCQVLCAMALLGKGGHFVLKAFDLFSKVSVDLMYILWTHFDKVCIFKPNQSRPANSERYVFAQGLRQARPPVVEYLMHVNDRMNALKQDTSAVRRQQRAVVGVVAEDVLPPEFLHHLAQSNEVLGRKQVASLRKVHNFIRDPSLPGEDQSKIRLECLEHWKVPTTSPEALYLQTTADPAAFLRDSPVLQCVDGDPKAPSPPNTRVVVGALGDGHVRGPGALMRNKHEWRVCVVATGGPSQVMDGYFMTLPNRVTYHMRLHDRHGAGRWQVVEGLVLPPFTFLCGEIVGERPHTSWEGGGQYQPRAHMALHVRDAMLVGGLDVRRNPYEERMQHIRLFTEAIDRLAGALDSTSRGHCAAVDNDDVGVHRAAGGLLFFPVCVNSPAGGWIRAFNREASIFHWENLFSHETAPEEKFRCIALSFRKTVESTVLWTPRSVVSREALNRSLLSKP